MEHPSRAVRLWDLLFSVLLFALIAAAVWQAREWDIRASLFPLVVGLPLLGLLGVQAIKAALAYRAATPETTGRFAVADEQAEGLAGRAGITILAWIVGSFGIVWLLGFQLGLPAATAAYLTVEGRERPTILVGVTAGTAVLTLALAELLHMPFPPGVLFQLAGAA